MTLTNTTLSEAYAFHLSSLRHMHRHHPRFREKIIGGAKGALLAFEHSEEARDIDSLAIHVLIAVDAYSELANDVLSLKNACRRRMRGEDVVEINEAGRQLAALDEQLSMVLSERDRLSELYARLQEVIARAQPQLPLSVEGGVLIEYSLR